MDSRRLAYEWIGQRRVEGWIEPQILPVVRALADEQDRLGIAGGAAEIGIHHGRLFIALHLSRTAGARSVAIDLFGDQDGNLDHSGRGDREIFVRALERHAGGLDDVSIWPVDSTTVSGADIRSRIGDIRVFDVDGGHTADLVHHDLHCAAEAVVEGGIILSDDTFNPGWPGVWEGTYRFLQEQHRVVPFAIAFNKVLFTTPAHVERYQATLRAVAQRHLYRAKLSTMVGSPVLILRCVDTRKRLRLAASHVRTTHPRATAVPARVVRAVRATR